MVAGLASNDFFQSDAGLARNISLVTDFLFVARKPTFICESLDRSRLGLVSRNRLPDCRPVAESAIRQNANISNRPKAGAPDTREIFLRAHSRLSRMGHAHFACHERSSPQWRRRHTSANQGCILIQSNPIALSARSVISIGTSGNGDNYANGHCFQD